jgi:parallel beta-helix repeat protein
MNATIINIPNDYTTIQKGIDNAMQGDTVLVMAGNYPENINFKGKLITVSSHFMFTSDTSTITTTIINGNNVAPTVTFETSENATAIITGFTITGGGKDSTSTFGGGIICNNASPTIFRNRLINNGYVTGMYGGGIICYNSSALIEENYLDSNNSYFVDNVGSIVCHFSTPTIRNNYISNTMAGYLFHAGGGIFCMNSSVIITGNVIFKNTYFDNFAGGICMEASTGLIRNNTIVNNFSGISLLDSNNLEIVNNIIYLNDSSFMILGGTDTLSVNYNDIEGGWPNGVSNIDFYPLFEDTLTDDYHLLVFSPCINSGDPSTPYDPDNTVSDMGALFFDTGTSIDFISDELKISISPNPVASTFSILSEILLSQLILIDIHGRVVEELDPSQRNFDIQKLASGIYFLRVLSKDTSINKVLIKN